MKHLPDLCPTLVVISHFDRWRGISIQDLEMSLEKTSSPQ